MKQLNCFVIIPSNREEGKPVKFLKDDRWGLIEYPTGCKEPSEIENQIELNFDTVYEHIIREAIDKLNRKYANKQIIIECQRGKDIKEPGDIINQVMKNICTVEITITDVTANNPNDYIEYGIRLSVKDELNIMVCHEKVKLPFDIQKLRCIYYSTTNLDKANQAIKKIIDSISAYIDKKVLNEQQEEYRYGPGFGYKQLVELYTGRKQERKLVNVFEKAPEIIVDLASFYFAKEEKIGLRQEIFEFLDSVGKALTGHSAINHFELVSNIKGLSNEKLQDTYFQLARLCHEDPNFKDRAEKYRELLKNLEE